MNERRLLILTLFPPPEGFIETYERVRLRSEPVAVLLAGEGVLNSIPDCSDLYRLRVDLEGRGIVSGEGAISDEEAAILILSASSVITFT
ncbi:MAG: hypothetical protein ACYCXP_05660 [Leptospirillum sp.]|jgi:hypothetical protein|nr:hypothetical protein [Nitrospiraceae bacterium]